MGENILQMAAIAEQAHRIVDEIEHVIIGKRDTVEKAVLTLLCDGHLLIEDIPGVGKTTLAKAIARVIGGDFRRVQFTPDLLPADVTGSSIFNQQTSQFEFRPGPVFGNVVLVDEINRATPKTQSSLLESMEERQVTTDGITRPLPEPFFVIATQNTVEMSGTYPLPEAQLDRFFARVSLGYPSKEDEAAILDSQQTAHPLETVSQLMGPEAMIAMQAGVRTVFVHEAIREFVVDIVRATRTSNQLLMGASPRGSLYLMRASQACAAMDGCDYVRPDDVQGVAPLVLGHRVIARSDSRAHGLESADIISKIVATVPAPVPAPIA